ncbi:TlpA disulfide reductase family protein [Thiomicrorhabdus indica]|uniref:TlpA family protein disulfide reductase n=1 Tax=Thiomicrorhabdus indica TaxID=2267253 RepID=UPI002AA78805|nr:TlpA disulfide reductase family protein [Thiomicrorhabdus indica]
MYSTLTKLIQMLVIFSSLIWVSPNSFAYAETLALHKLSPELQNYTGRWIYLDFWASWCAPCQASFPFMNQLHQQMQSKNFTVVAVNVDENRQDADIFLQTTPASFPILFDAQGTLPSALQVQAMPTSYLINPEGQIVWQHQGFLKKDAESIQQLIQQKIQGN